MDHLWWCYKIFVWYAIKVVLVIIKIILYHCRLFQWHKYKRKLYSGFCSHLLISMVLRVSVKLKILRKICMNKTLKRLFVGSFEQNKLKNVKWGFIFVFIISRNRMVYIDCRISQQDVGEGGLEKSKNQLRIWITLNCIVYGLIIYSLGIS